MSPEKLLYAPTHEWVRIEPEGAEQVAVIGISAFAIEALTDLVHMQLPPLGKRLQPGETFGEIESVKAVSDLYSPVEGEVIAINSELLNRLEILNTDPYQQGWLVKVRLTSNSGLAELLDHAAYVKQCEH